MCVCVHICLHKHPQFKCIVTPRILVSGWFSLFATKKSGPRRVQGSAVAREKGRPGRVVNNHDVTRKIRNQNIIAEVLHLS